jgi:hypothetical protein
MIKEEGGLDAETRIRVAIPLVGAPLLSRLGVEYPTKA